MNESITNGRMNEKRLTQGAPALFTMIALLLRNGRKAQNAQILGGRLERLLYVTAEVHVRMGRWNA